MFSTCIFFFFFCSHAVMQGKALENPRRSLIIHDWGVFSLLWSCSALPSAGLRGQGSAADRNVFFASMPRRLAQGEGDFFSVYFFLGGKAALPFYLMERQTAVFGRGWHALTLPPQALIRRRIPSRPIQSSPVQSRPVPSHAVLHCAALRYANTSVPGPQHRCR